MKPGDITFAAEMKSVKAKPKKTVSFAESNQFFVIEYQEPIEEDDREYSVNNDIESMISGDETASSHVSFNALDKLSAGTALDTTTFNAFPRRLSVESVGPAGFSMEEVIQKLLNIQACNAIDTVRLEITNLENLGDRSGDSMAEESTIASEHDASDDSDDEDLSPKEGTALIADETYKKSHTRLSLDSIIGGGLTRLNPDSKRPIDDLKWDDITAPLPDNVPECAPMRLSLDLIISGGSSKRSSVDILSPIPDLDAQVVATPRRAVSTTGFRSSPSDSRKASLEVLQTANTPLADYHPATEQELNAMNQTKPLPPPQSTLLQQTSASQFRRNERMKRHSSVAVDMANGVEKYSKIKLYSNILFLWIILPTVLCSLSYGAIPYDDFVNTSILSLSGVEISRSLGDVGARIWAVTTVPWALIMCSVSLLSVEVYSLVVSEIEFGAVLLDSSPSTLVLTGVLATFFSMTMQALIFAAAGPGSIRNWLAEIAAGSFSIAMVLCYVFFSSRTSSFIEESAASREATKAFFHCLLGIFVLISVGGTGYTLFAIVYSQYSSLHRGAVGIVLAIIFPMLRILLSVLIHNSPGLQWGSKRGYLCTGLVAPIVAAMWHAAFACLLVGTTSTTNQCITLVVVESFIHGLAVMEILKLPPSANTTRELDGNVRINLKYKSDNKNPLQPQVSGSWRSKSSVAVDFQSHSQRQDALSCKKSIHLDDGKSEPGSINVRDSRWLRDKMRSSGLTSNTSSVKMLRENAKMTPDVTVFSLFKSTRRRTPADDRREVVLATWLAVTWISGILTPISFLICAAVFSAGWNRRLFSLEILFEDRSNLNAVLAMTSDWEVSANLHRIWSVDVFGTGHHPSAFVYKLLLMSACHILLLWLGCYVLVVQKIPHACLCGVREDIENRRGEEPDDTGSDIDTDIRNTSAAGDIQGLMSAALEYNYSVIALSAVMAMSIVFSIIFPWFGMNSSF